jgi:sugar/nucleoside kinase (ribokinase family)
MRRLFSRVVCPRMPKQGLYAGLIARARQFGCKTFLDTSGEPLRMALSENPDFVKPNRQEAEQLLGTPIRSFSDAVSSLRNLLRLGAQSATLSIGSDGLLFYPSTDACFLHQFIRGAKIEECLRYDNLTGALSTTGGGGTEAFRDTTHRESFLAQ